MHWEPTWMIFGFFYALFPMCVCRYSFAPSHGCNIDIIKGLGLEQFKRMSNDTLEIKCLHPSKYNRSLHTGQRFKSLGHR